jgi:hypothetical protein
MERPFLRLPTPHNHSGSHSIHPLPDAIERGLPGKTAQAAVTVCFSRSPARLSLIMVGGMREGRDRDGLLHVESCAPILLAGRAI